MARGTDALSADTLSLVGLTRLRLEPFGRAGAVTCSSYTTTTRLRPGTTVRG